MMRSSSAAASIPSITVDSKVSAASSSANKASSGSSGVRSSTNRPVGAINNPALSGSGLGAFSETLTDSAAKKITTNSSGTKTVMTLLIPARIRQMALSKSMFYSSIAWAVRRSRPLNRM